MSKHAACSHCGAANPSDFTFCFSCSAPKGHRTVSSKRATAAEPVEETARLQDVAESDGGAEAPAPKKKRAAKKAAAKK